MRQFKMLAVAVLAASLSGCMATGSGPDSLQCTLGRILGQECGAETLQTSERWDRVQKAFDAEIAQARQAQQKAVATSTRLPQRQQATAGEITTLNVLITDSKTKEQKSIRTLDTVEVSLPLSGKGKAAHMETFDAILDFANVVADNRGSAAVLVYQNPADVKAGRANPTGSVLKSPLGKPVNVRKVSDSNTPVGVERYVVKSGEVRGQI